jgi:hypothetical protein
MMMSRVRRTVAAGSGFVAAALIAGCGGPASAAEQTAHAPGAQDSAALAAQAEPVSLVIQMSGLLLLVPPKQPMANTDVLMPDVANHDAILGFNVPADPGNCDAYYDVNLHICYVKINGWSLAAVGDPYPIGGFPKGAANLTHFAGKQIDVSDAKSRSRADVALVAGIVTDTCSLASWTFNPIGNDGPERLAFINVMEWVVPVVPPGNLTLRLTKKDNPAVTKTLGPLIPNDQNEIELLVMHLPQTELQAIYTGVPVVTPDHNDSAAVISNVSNEMKVHFDAFYRTIGLQQASIRPVPQRPRRNRDVCPITILGLADRFSRNESSQRGTKTLSCVMASAEQT